MFETEAPKSSKKTVGITMGLYFLAIILLFAGRFFESYVVFIDVLAVFAFSVAIFYSAKYLLISYIYAIEEEDGEILFSVTEVQGKRVTVVCRMGVRELVSVTKIDREHPMPKGTKCYSYSRDIQPAEALLLEFDDDGSLFVRVAYDRELSDRLAGYVAQNSPDDFE